MAVSLGSRTGRGGRYRPLAEINVTPLVDVMLVLLIIFMVAAPLMTSGVNVDLPKANASSVNQDSEPVTVSVNAEGRVFLQENDVQLPELVTKLREIANNQPDRRIFVRGDKGIQYGRVMEVMGTIIQGGFTKVALLTEGTAITEGAGAAPAAGGAAGTGTGAAQPAASPVGRTGGQPAAGAVPTGRRQGRG